MKKSTKHEKSAEHEKVNGMKMQRLKAKRLNIETRIKSHKKHLKVKTNYESQNKM